MQLLLIVIYILAQLLGNGGGAPDSTPASSPSTAKYNYLILNPDCKPTPIEESDYDEEYQLVDYPGANNGAAAGCSLQNYNTAFIEAVYRVTGPRPLPAVTDT